VLTSKGGLIAHGIPCAALHGSEVLQVDSDDDTVAAAAALAQQQQQQSQEDSGKLKHFLSIPPKLQSAAGYTSSGTLDSSLHTQFTSDHMCELCSA
jgi:hypothetical protein